MTTDKVIVTSNLSRSFRVRLKSEGLAASVKNFFSPVYKTVEAVKDLNIEIGRGEIIGFLGPNGAGKTTTLKMLSGLLIPTSGTIKVLNYEPFARKKEFLKKISLIMGQKQNLWWDLPPIETFVIHKSIYQIEEKDFNERVEELVEMLEIQDCLETQTRKLSLGQRMRCELAVSLLHRPEVLFLDEPTIGLDILMQKKVRSFLLDYHFRFKPTILLTSHYMEDVAALSQRIIVIDLGKKIFDGGLRELTDRIHPEKIISVVFNRKPDDKILASLGKIVCSEGTIYKFKVPRSEAPETAARIYSTGLIDDLSIEDPPLEDIVGQLFIESNKSRKSPKDDSVK
ncbi:MAG: ATP-binding cassette domain-containing protein [Candidatus Rifleibacteriota bacterium]